MVEGQRADSHDSLVSELMHLLSEYEGKSSRLPLREQVTLVVRMQETVRQLGVAIGVRAGFSGSSARDRILSYLQAYPNQVIAGMELASISGISEYGRRIREIRSAGHTILTGPHGKDPKSGTYLRTDEYVFVSDSKAASRKPFDD